MLASGGKNMEITSEIISKIRAGDESYDKEVTENMGNLKGEEFWEFTHKLDSDIKSKILFRLLKRDKKEFLRVTNNIKEETMKYFNTLNKNISEVDMHK